MNGITAKSILIVAAVCATVLGFIFWRVESHSAIGKTATHAVIVADISESVAKDPAAIVGLAERTFHLPGFGKSSTLAVLATGDDDSAGEPRLLAKYPMPFSRRTVEGKGSVLKKQREIMKDIDSKIKKTAATDRSPIFLAVKRAVEYLRANRCQKDSECYLFVRSDGEELSEQSIRQSLAAARNRKDLPAAIANEGIQVSFCGLAEVNSSRNADGGRPHSHTAKHGERIRDVWLALFNVPELVSFEPYCPKSDMAERASR